MAKSVSIDEQPPECPVMQQVENEMKVLMSIVEKLDAAPMDDEELKKIAAQETKELFKSVNAFSEEMANMFPLPNLVSGLEPDFEDTTQIMNGILESLQTAEEKKTIAKKAQKEKPAEPSEQVTATHQLAGPAAQPAPGDEPDFTNLEQVMKYMMEAMKDSSVMDNIAMEAHNEYKHEAAEAPHKLWDYGTTSYDADQNETVEFVEHSVTPTFLSEQAAQLESGNAPEFIDMVDWIAMHEEPNEKDGSNSTMEDQNEYYHKDTEVTHEVWKYTSKSFETDKADITGFVEFGDYETEMLVITEQATLPVPGVGPEFDVADQIIDDFINKMKIDDEMETVVMETQNEDHGEASEAAHKLSKKAPSSKYKNEIAQLYARVKYTTKRLEDFEKITSDNIRLTRIAKANKLKVATVDLDQKHSELLSIRKGLLGMRLILLEVQMTPGLNIKVVRRIGKFLDDADNILHTLEAEEYIYLFKKMKNKRSRRKRHSELVAERRVDINFIVSITSIEEVVNVMDFLEHFPDGCYKKTVFTQLRCVVDRKFGKELTKKK